MGLITLRDMGLGGLGQADCGPKPGLGPGEKAVCCPGVGWVIYDQYESEFGICEKAKAYGGSSGGDDSDQPAPTDIEGRRAAIERRREEMEERRFQQQLQLALLRGQMSRAQAAQQAVADKERRKREAEIAKIEARAELERREKNKKLMTMGALALAAAKVFALF
jgi:hypothetical protein